MPQSPDLCEHTATSPVNMEDVTPKEPTKDPMAAIAAEMADMKIPPKMIIFILDQLKNVQRDPRGRRYCYQTFCLNI